MGVPMLGLGFRVLTRAARLRPGLSPGAHNRRFKCRSHSTERPQASAPRSIDGSGRSAAAEAAEAAEATEAVAAHTALSIESLMKVALGIPLLAPSLFFIGQGMEEKTFLGEVEAWSQQEQYQHSDAERLAARDCVRYIMAGQVSGLAIGGTVGWAIGGLRAIPIALCAMVGGQVGAVYPTQLTTRSLLTLPGTRYLHYCTPGSVGLVAVGRSESTRP